MSRRGKNGVMSNTGSINGAPLSDQPSERINRRAYELYEFRGGDHVTTRTTGSKRNGRSERKLQPNPERNTYASRRAEATHITCEFRRRARWQTEA